MVVVCRPGQQGYGYATLAGYSSECLVCPVQSSLPASEWVDVERADGGPGRYDRTGQGTSDGRDGGGAPGSGTTCADDM